MLDLLPDPTAVLDPVGCVVAENAVWCALFGASTVGQSLDDRIHDHDRSAFQDARLSSGRCDARLANDRTFQAWCFKTTDDRTVVTTRAVLDPREDLVQLREHLHLWDLAAALSNVGYWVLDVVAESIYWSPQIYVIHGRDPATYRASLREGIDAYHPDDRATVTAHVERALADATPFDFEMRLIRTDGSVRNVLSSGRPERDPDGVVRRVIGVFRDVTDERRIAREAADARVLAASNAQLERFAYAVSHDLKAPLRGIRACADWLADDPAMPLSPDARENLGFIQSRVARLEQMIDGVLAFSRASGTSTPPETFALGDLVTLVALDLPGPVELDALPTLHTDRVAVERVFQNLLTNAFEHGAQRVRVGTDGDRIVVDDDGPGIPEARRDDVFDLFRTLQSRDAHESSGVGLSIVKAAVERLGGEVGITDSPLGGARFWVWLPTPPPMD